MQPSAASSLAGACARIGAVSYLAGLIEPSETLTQLSQPRHLSGKKARTSILSTYPSYLGQLVETGVRLGYGPADFGLEKVLIGGEILTEDSKTALAQCSGMLSLGRITPSLKPFRLAELGVSRATCISSHHTAWPKSWTRTRACRHSQANSAPWCLRHFLHFERQPSSCGMTRKTLCAQFRAH